MERKNRSGCFVGALALVTVLAAPAAADPLSGLVDDRPSACPDLEDLAPGGSVVVACVDGILHGTSDGSAGGSCPAPWTGQPVWYFERFPDAAELWTPLYGTNSPYTGTGRVVDESAAGSQMTIGYAFGQAGVELSKAETRSVSVGIAAHNGESRVRYQFLEWSLFRATFCANGHTYDHWRVTSYRPTGRYEWGRGALEGSSLTTDFDNRYAPAAMETPTPDLRGKPAILFDISLTYNEGSDCFGRGDHIEFGSGAIYSARAWFDHEGYMQVGHTTTRTENDLFRYDFTDPGCYHFDFLGTSGPDESRGLAFHYVGPPGGGGGGDDGCALVGGDVLASQADSCCTVGTGSDCCALEGQKQGVCCDPEEGPCCLVLFDGDGMACKNPCASALSSEAACGEDPCPGPEVECPPPEPEPCDATVRCPEVDCTTTKLGCPEPPCGPEECSGDPPCPTGRLCREPQPCGEVGVAAQPPRDNLTAAATGGAVDPCPTAA